MDESKIVRTDGGEVLGVFSGPQRVLDSRGAAIIDDLRHQDHGYKVTIDVFILDGPDAHTDDDALKAGVSYAAGEVIRIAKLGFDIEMFGFPETWRIEHVRTEIVGGL